MPPAASIFPFAVPLMPSTTTVKATVISPTPRSLTGRSLRSTSRFAFKVARFTVSPAENLASETEVHHLELHAAVVPETALGQPTLDRHLAALEPPGHLAARARLLPLVARPAVPPRPVAVPLPRRLRSRVAPDAGLMCPIRMVPSVLFMTPPSRLPPPSWPGTPLPSWRPPPSWSSPSAPWRWTRTGPPPRRWRARRAPGGDLEDHAADLRRVLLHDGVIDPAQAERLDRPLVLFDAADLAPLLRDFNFGHCLPPCA